MDDDLRRRLEAMGQRVPEGRPDVVPVMRGGKRLRVQRTVMGAAGVLLLVMATAFGVGQLVGGQSPPRDEEVANHEDGVFVPADKGESTYELFDFKIRYPWAPVDSIPAGRDHYCDTHGEWACGHRRQQAGFAYQWRWATGKYPGEVQCRVLLFGKDGSIVGRQEWGHSGLEPRSRPDRRGLVVPVRVSGPPVRAQAECEAGAYEPGPGFDITFVRAETYTPPQFGDESFPDRIRLVFDVDGTVPHADSRFCRMTVWFESGAVKRGGGTMNLSDGPLELETGYPASEPVEDAQIKCRAIRASDSR